MSDPKRWTLLALLDEQFLANIKFAIVFGNFGGEALVATRDDDIYAIGGPSGSIISPKQPNKLFEPIRVEEICKKEIVSVCVGQSPHVLALSARGQIFAWGTNTYGQVGTNVECAAVPSPTLVVALGSQKVVQIACGNFHSVALTDKGEVFAWGLNNSGQLGVGSTINHGIPKKVEGQLHNRFVKFVSCGQKSTLALTECGEVYAWGFNDCGQLGCGNFSNQHSPILVRNLHNVVVTHIASGYAHSLALSDDGQLFAWGSNSCCQLGENLSRSNQPLPVPVDQRRMDRIIEVAAIHACNITVAMNHEEKVFMWGQVKGHTTDIPIETRFPSCDDVFACFANPASCKLIEFEKPKEKSGVGEAIRGSFDDPDTADLKIVVEGKPIYAHKSFLRMRSQYFRSRFGEHWTESTENEISINEYTYTAYRTFLRWLYTDELDCGLDLHLLLDILELANCYCESQLQHICSEILKRHITVSTAATLYAAAVKYELLSLEQFVFKFCLNHMTAVTQTFASAKDLPDSIFKRFIVEASNHGAFKN
ncbi:hypothetical protein QR680_015254 [Steinernema hermaphroditum]|uniref:BTB domain-containing protein n=1 Tax=Steinernema hermaphroditum TaxID=289476 RepID=A0AA39H7B0_9BILA|nr:hypothetical protein QR680_015254 [Steinernema hermaphroditum]